MSVRILETISILLLAGVPAGARTISVDECLKMGADNELSVRNARLDVASASSVKREMQWNYFPTLALGAFGYQAVNPLVKVTVKDILGNSDAANNLNENITAYANENGIKPYYSGFGKGYSAGASAFQPVYAGGSVRYSNRLAALGVEAARTRESIVLRESADSIETKYWRIVALMEKQSTLKEARNLLDSLENNLGSAVGAGLAVSSDMLKLRHRKSELNSAGIRLKSGIKLLKMDLFNTIGLEYSFLGLDTLVLADRPGELPSPDSYIRPDDDYVVFEESRLLDLQVESKKVEKKISRSAALPKLGVGVNFGYANMMGTYGTLNGLGYVALQVPLTDIGKTAERSRRYACEISKAENQRQFFDSQLRTRLMQLRLDMVTAWEQYLVSKEEVAVEEDGCRKVSADYRAGMSTLSQVLESEVSLQSSREKCIECRIAYRNAVRRYLQHCGRGAEL